VSLPSHPDAFIERLRMEGNRRYHDKHPFHRAMHEGQLSREEIQAWVLNRYYYQTRIPIKDALVLSKSEDREFRRVWMRRLSDHDTEGEGLDQWLRLAAGVGLDPEHVRSCSGVLLRFDSRAMRTSTSFVSTLCLKQSLLR